MPAMTDIEKRTFKINAIRATTIIISVVVCTWQLRGVVNNLVDKIDRTDEFVRGQAKKDSVRDERVARLYDYRREDRHDIDSLSDVIRPVTLRISPTNFGYYTQKWVNGRLVRTPYHQ